VLVITGGSQGSLAINRIVAAWLRGGGAELAQVIWCTGRATHAEFAFLHNPPHIHVIPFLDPMSDAWSVANLCVARSGMMTLAELCAWGIPSVLIPLPTAAADHQTHNAEAMARAGAAVALPQEGLDATRFGVVVRQLLGDGARLDAMSVAARARGKPEAAATIAKRIEQLTTGTT
jgi:UDP-N-acetylglucosamine--N-acetylmuramyl-(pentapeptide) pyrophosphoryl-undecaprenol N-acetylglucosamine transferase